MRFLLLAIICAIIFSACSKQTNPEEWNKPTTWKETDSYYSTGGPITWKKTETKDAEILQFKENNIFSSTVYTQFNRYKIETADATNSLARLKLYEAGKPDTTYWFLKTVTPNTIEVGHSGCIEGCGKRFLQVTE